MDTLKQLIVGLGVIILSAIVVDSVIEVHGGNALWGIVFAFVLYSIHSYRVS
jgi:hypothetical protein